MRALPYLVLGFLFLALALELLGVAPGIHRWALGLATLACLGWILGNRSRPLAALALSHPDPPQHLDEAVRTIQATRETLERAGGALQQDTGGVGSLIHQVSSHVQAQNELIGEAVVLVVGLDDALASAARSASQAVDSTYESFQAISDGMGMVDHMVSTMMGLQGSVQRAARAVEELSSEALGIGDIVGSVNTIARKTNMLAINAGIVAAHAGEQGRGFAVIASEIRQLSSQTSQALQSIQDILLRVKGRSQEVVKTMEEGSTHVEEGAALASSVGSSITQVLQAMHNNQAQVQQILDTNESIKVQSDILVEKLLGVATLVEETAQKAAALATFSSVAGGSTEVMAETIRIMERQVEHLDRLLANQLESVAEPDIV